MSESLMCKIKYALHFIWHASSGQLYPYDILSQQVFNITQKAAYVYVREKSVQVLEEQILKG